MPKAVGHRVLIEIKKKEEKTKGGIILTEDSRNKEQYGTDIGIVRHLGPTCYADERLGREPWVQPGDKIYFVRYAGITLETPDGRLYKFINDEDIYGLVEEGDRDE